MHLGVVTRTNPAGRVFEFRAVAGIQGDQEPAHKNGVNNGDDCYADRVFRSEPDTLGFAAAVDVRDRSEEAERYPGQQHASPRLVHVQQQLLEVEEVPGRLRWVGRDVWVRAVEQRRVDKYGQDQERDRKQYGRDELDEDEVRPNEHLLLAFALGPRARDAWGSSRYGRCFNRHWRVSP